MNNALRRFGPAGLVLTVAAWCCWPHLAESDAPLADYNTPKSARVDKDRLQPQLPPKPDRDPFSIVEPEVQPMETVLVEAAEVEEVEEEPIYSEPAPRSWKEAAEDLRLRATVASSRKQSALIDDRIYTLGEQIGLTAASEPFCVLSDISNNHVVLRVGEETIQLAYRDNTQPAKEIKEQKPAIPVADGDHERSAGTELLEQWSKKFQIGVTDYKAIEAAASAPASRGN